MIRTSVVASLLVLCSGLRAGTLDDRLAPLVKAHKGQVAIAVKPLDGGDMFTLNADERMPTASLIKLAVMVEAYWQAKEGKFKLTDTIALRKEDMVQGSGILTDHFSPGATFCVRDAVRMMIVFSDNTATNLVLDKTGIKAVNDRMASLKLPQTRINAKVFRGGTTSIDPEATKKFGLGSTTAREMVTLLDLIHRGQVVDADACKEMIGHLKKCEDKDKFTRYLPAGTAVAHKTGSVSDARTDAGIIYLKTGPVALCVLTNGNEDKSWTPDNAGNQLCAKVAKEVADYYSTK